ncbi:MAG: DUF485 domain-containing protein [Deltaproteobacteria bacterium]|jgi:uncharacterized membrane protein (DUF485 family)|nr:DUF485 domain-containing protein [Deltaproteobacteria bacterium]
MAEQYDWAAIARNPKYLELKRRKRIFLFGWWIASSIYYFLLAILAAFAPELFKIKVIGVINFGYVFILSEFVMCIIVALYYTHVANKDFDRMTNELIESLHQGGAI